jgi:putative Mg2+ transporter-C (MgtC) family protein
MSLQVAVFLRIALAALFGFAIGLEREWRGKLAGERTFALVAVGSAAFTAVGVEMFPDSAEKIMAGVATGIGFLGVGIMWRMEGGQTRGLTTAAANWAVAAIGILVGSGVYLAGLLCTLLCLLILELDYLPFTGMLLHRMPGGGVGSDGAAGGDRPGMPPAP